MLEKSIDTIIDNIKTSKIILMDDMDKIMNEIMKIDKQTYLMTNIILRYTKYKYGKLKIININGDLVTLKIEDFYYPIKLANYGIMSTACHLNMFHMNVPQESFTNITFDLHFKKPVTQENTQISRYLIDKLYELNKSLDNINKNTGIIIFNNPSTSSSIQIELNNIELSPYSIIIFDNINNNNVIIKTIHPISIISYNSNIDIKFTYINPSNASCPIQEKITCPIQEKITCPIQEKIICPIQEKITCPIQETITCPIQETITCPIQEKINYFDNIYILILLLFFIILTILLTIKLLR